ncbi:MAG: NAD-dependent epimerase/dehydratase family protein [Lacisediminihabitans sp.]
MRRVLILGGTAWLGQEIAGRLLAGGDDVTCLARGESGMPPVGVRFVRADRAEEGTYEAIADEPWDDVIELSYEPSWVTGALDALAKTATHWTLVSSVSVYASNSEPDADESAAVLQPVDLEVYGQAKVAAERAPAAALGDRLLIVRAGLIGGPGDGSDRFGYWVSRFALAEDGPVLTPFADGRMVQVIDVQDLAEWVGDAGRRELTGVYNATGNQHSLADVLALAADVAGFHGQMTVASDSWFLKNDVHYWAGARSLPLWLPASDVPFAQRDNSAFLASGGTLRGLRDTMSRTLDDERTRGLARSRRSGLTRAEELELLNTLG